MNTLEGREPYRPYMKYCIICMEYFALRLAYLEEELKGEEESLNTSS
jgi:hypothetical protein